jgi:hypothetical protein
MFFVNFVSFVDKFILSASSVPPWWFCRTASPPAQQAPHPMAEDDDADDRGADRGQQDGGAAYVQRIAQVGMAVPRNGLGHRLQALLNISVVSTPAMHNASRHHSIRLTPNTTAAAITTAAMNRWTKKLL